MTLVSLNRTLEQELLGLLRGASLECLACGEFVLRVESRILCPECGSSLEGVGEHQVQLGLQAG